jgi:hypothetical protein
MFPMKADLNNLVRLPNRNFLNDAGIENSLGPLVTRRLLRLSKNLFCHIETRAIIPGSRLGKPNKK